MTGQPKPPSEARYPAIKPRQRTGAEPFHAAGVALDFDIRMFWSWSASNLVDNALRGMVAEFLVARALGTAEGVRIEWDAYDCLTRDGKRVEVKSAAHLQSWPQEKLSTIRFGIAKTRSWEAATNEYSAEPNREAEVYVFCLLAHKDQDTLDPTDVDQWRFYVVATRSLDDTLEDQKSLGLAALGKLAQPVRFAGISAEMDRVLG